MNASPQQNPRLAGSGRLCSCGRTTGPTLHDRWPRRARPAAWQHPRLPDGESAFPHPIALSGIYATWVHGIFEQPWPSVSSFGTRPTVAGVEPLLEVHLFDFHSDLYGRRIDVEFIAKLRDEETFPTSSQ